MNITYVFQMEVSIFSPLLSFPTTSAPMHHELGDWTEGVQFLQLHSGVLHFTNGRPLSFAPTRAGPPLPQTSRSIRANLILCIITMSPMPFPQVSTFSGNTHLNARGFVVAWTTLGGWNPALCTQHSLLRIFWHFLSMRVHLLEIVDVCYILFCVTESAS